MDMRTTICESVQYWLDSGVEFELACEFAGVRPLELVMALPHYKADDKDVLAVHVDLWRVKEAQKIYDCLMRRTLQGEIKSQTTTTYERDEDGNLVRQVRTVVGDNNDALALQLLKQLMPHDFNQASVEASELNDLVEAKLIEFIGVESGADVEADAD